uniref:RNA-directed DNA polymerase n=1 Tax=Caenorhabditis elegans TaxID=6239 RepID=Q17329_CAEEL|nr:gag, pol and env protein precursor [Caenorhabditis elegans]
MEVNEGQDTEGGSSRAQTLTPPPNPQQQLYDEEDLLRESMDTTEKTFENGFQVRKAEHEVKKKDVIKHIQNYAKANEAQTALMVEPFIKIIKEEEDIIEIREKSIMMLKKVVNEQGITISDLQIQKEQIRQHLQDSSQRGTAEDAETQKMKQFLDTNELHNVSDLEEIIKEYSVLKMKEEKEKQCLQMASDSWAMMREEIMEKRETNRDLNRQLKEKSEELMQKSQILVETTLKLKAVEEERDKRKKEEQFREADARSNNYARKGEISSNIEQKNHQNIQIMDTRCTTSSSRMNTPAQRIGENLSTSNVGNNVVRETVREYCEETGEILEDFEVNQNDSVLTERNVTGSVRNGDSQVQTNSLERMTQMMLAQSLPEPAKFTAEEGSISIEAFEKTFKLKFGTFSDEQQVAILESKYLEGRAQKAYRSLTAGEKVKVKVVLNALANRLRLSVEDENHRAKQKWNILSRKPDQSCEDYCLLIDDIARIAFRRVSPEELSSMKYVKLLDEVTDMHLRCSIDNKIMDTDEINHYDVCREMIIRHEWNVSKINEKQCLNSKLSEKRGKVQNAENFVNQNTQNNFKPFSPNKAADNSRNSWNNNSQNNSAASQNISREQSWKTISVPQKHQNPSDRCSDCQQRGWHMFWCSKKSKDNASQKCDECQQSGWHMASCFKLKNRACFRCNEMGHIAWNCPKKNENTSEKEAPVAKVETIEGVRMKDCLLMVKSEKSESEVTRSLEKGQIGKANVEILLDSGASISLMSKNTWEKIVEVNGKSWEQDQIYEELEYKTARTANNQLFTLLRAVMVEIKMQTKSEVIKFHIGDMDRENVIIGAGHFEQMGIQMNMIIEPRIVRIDEDVEIPPRSCQLVEVNVTGIIREGAYCLITPTMRHVENAVVRLNEQGKAWVRIVNQFKHMLSLKKGEVIGKGETGGFEVLSNKAEQDITVEEVLNDPTLFSEIETDTNSCEVVKTAETYERFTTICEHLKRENGDDRKIWDVIEQFQDVFAISDDELGRNSGTECVIELKEGAEPIRQKPRPIPLALKPEIRKMIQKMLNQKVIRESKSPWSSPVVLVKKKDGSIRMCIDYRKVNKVVKNNAHPLPNIEATLQSLAGKKLYTVFDMIAGFWQIPLDEKSKEITAFAIGSELFEWNVLPFGLVISPALFQGTMEEIIGDLLGVCAFVYVDDLLIASKDMEQHLQDVKEALTRIRKSGMKLRASKCHIAKKEVEYLGHKVTLDGVETQEVKTDKMKQFSRPTNVKELQSFLGLVGYYRKFILNFAQIASSLTSLISAKVAWIWEKEQEIAFQELKKLVCQTPVLAQPDVEAALKGDRPFMIYTDASRKGIGAVLAQEGPDGQQHPIAFASKALSPAETRYHITDLEALAMMFALRRFKTIIYGTAITVFTDHKPLISLLKGSPLADRLWRWSIEILEFDVKIVYLAGKANAVADALSRGGCPPNELEEEQTKELTSIVNAIQTELPDILDSSCWLERLKGEDEGWKEVIAALEGGKTKGTFKIVGIESEISLEYYKIVGGVLKNTEIEEQSRSVVPEKIRTPLLKELHEGMLAGHFGIKKMWRMVHRKFYWPQMRVCVENCVRTCAKCLCANDHSKLTSSLTPYRMTFPLEIVACDLMDVGLSVQGNRYILTIIDLFTKYGTAVPIPDKKAETVLKAFVERWAIGEGRIPLKLLTDQGKEFVNGLFAQFTHMLKIEHITTKGYNSRANGAVERFNKTIMHIMKKKTAVPMEWDDQVVYAVYAYNNCVHENTGETPMFLMHGRDVMGPLEMSGEDAVGINYADMDEYKHLLTQELLKVQKIAKEHAMREQESYKSLFDQKYASKKHRFPQPGSRVLLEIPSEKLGAQCPKLVNKWSGPYRVISCSENSAEITPVLGKRKHILQIPFENLRVIPEAMPDILIVTKKGRSKKPEPEIYCDEITVVSENNENSCFSCRYICRCALKPCMFNMTLVPEAHTPSPTQLYRMYCIMEKSGNRKIDPKQLMAMSSRPLPSPLQITLPDKMMDNLFKDMIGCSSLWTYVAELGWENSYNRYVDKLLNENCGDILNGPGTMLILADGLRLEDLPVSTKNCFVCTDYDEETLIALQKKCCRERFKMIVLVIPFTIDVELVDCWNRLIAKISEETKILVVSNMTPDELEDHALLVEFTSILQKCRRVDDGYLEIISLHDRLEAHPRKTLEMTALAGKVEYWKAVQTRAKEVGMEWKAFELKRCTSDTPVKNSDCEASTSMKSASTVRTFEDRMVKRGNHNRVYHHFTPYGRKK